MTTEPREFWVVECFTHAEELEHKKFHKAFDSYHRAQVFLDKMRKSSDVTLIHVREVRE
jgi:hypothetical protein